MIPPARPATSVKHWFTDLRRIALITCVTGVLSLPMPIWNTAQTIAAVTEPKNYLWRLAGILALVVLTLFTVTLPAFYFALYRDEAILHFPKRLRLLALVAALTFAVIVVATLPAWVRSLVAYFAGLSVLDWSTGATDVLVFVRDPRTIGHLYTLLGVLSNVAYVFVLIAIFRRADEPLENSVPVSRLLRIMTKVAVIAWGFALLAVVLGLLSTPYNFYALRNYALQIGRQPPAFGDMLVRQIRAVLLQACLFATPYIVYRSQRERSETPVDGRSGLKLTESGG